MTAPPIQPGQILLRKYRVDRILGHGTMGMVLAATHLQAETTVALKIMLTAGPPSPEMAARFLREAKIAMRLRSPHTGRLNDYGELESGVPYFAMELFEGRDLAHVLRDRGQLPVDLAVSYVLQACHAVAEAHAAGIVHRDLKPANLFLTKDHTGWPTIKVLDFGVSKLDAEVTTLTKTGQGLGTPVYMAPEMMQGAKHVDARTDIWALGVVLYELLTEKRPFDGETMMDLCVKLRRDPPASLASYRPDLPPGLVTVIMHCFEKDPGQRWPNVHAFAAALAPYGPPGMAPYVTQIAGMMSASADVAASRPTPEPPAPTVPHPFAATRIFVNGVPGATVASDPLAALAALARPPAPAAPAAPAEGLPLDTYASVTRALARGEPRDAVLARHRLTSEQFDRQATAWAVRFRVEPHLLAGFNELVRSNAQR